CGRGCEDRRSSGRRQERTRCAGRNSEWEAARHRRRVGPGDGSITSGVPKKSRIFGPAAGMLMSSPARREKDLMAHQVRRAQRSMIPEPAPEVGGNVPPGATSALITPMNKVTHILAGIEAGDPHAAEQLLPLVYEELRKLATQKLAQEKPG